MSGGKPENSTVNAYRQDNLSNHRQIWDGLQMRGMQIADEKTYPAK